MNRLSLISTRPGGRIVVGDYGSYDGKAYLLEDFVVKLMEYVQSLESRIEDLEDRERDRQG